MRRPAVIRSMRRQPTPHATWCARDHRCGFAEHRSAEIVADEVGGRATATRVRAGDTEYVELRVRVPLHPTEAGATWQLAEILRLVRELMRAVAVRRGVVRARPDVRQVTR